MKLPQTKWIVVGAFIILFLLTFACSHRAHAESLTPSSSGWRAEAQTGSTIIRGEAWTAAFVIVDPGLIAGLADLRCKVQLIGPSTFRSAQQLQNGAIGCQILSGYKSFDLGLGAVVLEHSDAYNSGKYQFWLSLRYNLGNRWALEYSHHSNAGTSAPNEGRDFALLAYKF